MGNKTEARSLGILYGILGVVLFSTKAVLVKLAYRYEVDTLELLLFRMLFSLPFYVAILLLTYRKGQTKVASKGCFMDFPFWVSWVLYGQLF